MKDSNCSHVWRVCPICVNILTDYDTLIILGIAGLVGGVIGIIGGLCAGF